MRHTSLSIWGGAPRPPWTSKQLTLDIEALDTLERAQHHRQEQLCVPLVPADTYWYLSASPELMELAAERLHARFGARR